MADRDRQHEPGPTPDEPVRTDARDLRAGVPDAKDWKTRGWQEGPTGRAPPTESLGDPGAGNVRSGAEEGAAMGGLVGTAVAGPIGLAVGGVAGAAAGAAGESVDPEKGQGFGRRADGTGPVDPLT
ncbi:MAG: hypothetical protein ACJ771_10080, partial [Chloroflexota bacterium]